MTRHAIATQTDDRTFEERLEAQSILSPKQTYKLTSLSGATIWRLRRQGRFPEPIKLSPGRMGWRRADIEQWLADLQAVAGNLRPSPNPLTRRTPPPVPPPSPAPRAARVAPRPRQRAVPIYDHADE